MADLKAGYFIFIIVLLGFFGFLISTMPSGLIYSGTAYSYSQKTFPSYFSKDELANYTYFLNHTVNYPTITIPVTFAFPDGKVFYAWFGYRGYKTFFITDAGGAWVQLTGAVTGNTFLEITDVLVAENLITINGTVVSKWYAKTSSDTLVIYILDPDVERNDPILAWENNEILVSIGKGTSLNVQSGYDLLARLLSFQQIEGIPLWISYPINLLIWCLIAYCMIFLILEVLPDWL